MDGVDVCLWPERDLGPTGREGGGRCYPILGLGMFIVGSELVLAPDLASDPRACTPHGGGDDRDRCTDLRFRRLV